MDGGNHEQSCWLFPGLYGHLGIRLKERISVNKFTVEHLSRDTLSDFAILQAPRKVILWGRVDGHHNLLKVQQNDIVAGSPDSPFLRLSQRNRELFIPLASFEYKLSGGLGSNIQTKDVSKALLSLQMDFEVIVLEILNNWGAVSTCLYRVRVHGNPLKAVALRSILP